MNKVRKSIARVLFTYMGYPILQKGSAIFPDVTLVHGLCLVMKLNSK